MQIKSLIREKENLVPVEIELSFVPGLPQIQFLGLPDQALRESTHRIKSAIRSQGFEFPKAQQVLVNLRPSHLKKSSRGLELAVALGILWQTGQVPAPSESEVMIYGELSLAGEVFEPDDVAEDYEEEGLIWTGQGAGSPVPFARVALKTLSDVSSPDFIPATARSYSLQRPEFGLQMQFPERQADILKLVALGEHSLLLAGPAGSGKSTLAKTVASLMAEPSQADMHEILRNHRGVSAKEIQWRPLVHPHHSTTPLGLIGGGVPPTKGEVSRAHKGVLILDELLEFHPRAQEALREPMEEFLIRLRRGRFVEEHPAETLVISTTNLCPCGDWVPNCRVICSRSLKKCQSYMERLSGPLVDRFQVLFFTQKQEKEGACTGEDLLRTLEEVRNLRSEWAAKDSRFQKVAGRWSWEELTSDFSAFYLRELFPRELTSRRRDLATLRVARSLADLDRVLKVTPDHVERALKFTFAPFESLKRLGG